MAGLINSGLRETQQGNDFSMDLRSLLSDAHGFNMGRITYMRRFTYCLSHLKVKRRSSQTRRSRVSLNFL